MFNFNYTIIIPHKNIPNLLQRCLDSIPERGDIQIIIVDDNSDASKVDFNHFPGIGRKNVEVYLTKEGKGAGYARNVGLRHAKGKWLLFADADDYYVKDAFAILDKYLNSTIDIVFYNVSTDSPNSPCARITNTISKLLVAATKKGYIDSLKYKAWVPWNKMFKTEYIFRYQINFEEISRGNDMQFSFIASYFTHNIAIEMGIIYIYTYNTNSISFKKLNVTDYILKIEIEKKANAFFKFIGYSNWCSFIPRFICSVLKNRGIYLFIQVLYVYLMTWRNIQKESCKYVNKIKEISSLCEENLH